jgi:protein subunit release factor A
MLIEIRAAEGGDDAKQLVREMLKTYLTVADKECL